MLADPCLVGDLRILAEVRFGLDAYVLPGPFVSAQEYFTEGALANLFFYDKTIIDDRVLLHHT